MLDLFASAEVIKPQAIEPILAAFPRRRFVLVGDSGEKDPEVYGALARTHPDQIVRIFIRDVTDEPADAERYRRAFVDVPAEQWMIFKDPAEIAARLP